MFLTHIDKNGNDSPPIYIDNSTAANRAVNIPEFVNVAPDGIESIDVPASDFYRVVDEAMDLQGKGDVQGALTKWRDALVMDPQDARANNGIGIVLGQLRRTEEAVQYFKKAIEIDGDFFEAYYNLGIVLTREGRVDEAIDAWRNSIRVRPDYSQGHENLGYALYLSGNYSDSLTQYRMALEKDPNRLTTLNLAATLLATCPASSIRNGTEALELAERARQISAGKDPGILDTVSAALAEKGSFAQAIEVEQQGLALVTPQDDATLATTLKAHLATYMEHQPLRIAPDKAAF